MEVDVEAKPWSKISSIEARAFVYVVERRVSLNLGDYLGKYIKVYTIDSDWFICEPQLKEACHRTDESRVTIVVRSSKDSAYKVGEFYLKHIDIKKIEELNLNIQDGLKLTLNYAPDIKNAYSSNDEHF
ncbi:hypothetical protein NQ117_18325 [Paenibacillus sp. SC116]|uniref:hypothetical protein n=1 Tax=Paenibacillus sp. SC116 TaxID=2968986 RepID=UPI00215A4834|nr:hypothetical protein [Paenibacillus sp. SC116]MCR8845644.1 hypothetical protein [Paenibacillus sp. SC116]